MDGKIVFDDDISNETGLCTIISTCQDHCKSLAMKRPGRPVKRAGASGRCIYSNSQRACAHGSAYSPGGWHPDQHRRGPWGVWSLGCALILWCAADAVQGNCSPNLQPSVACVGRTTTCGAVSSAREAGCSGVRGPQGLGRYSAALAARRLTICRRADAAVSTSHPAQTPATHRRQSVSDNLSLAPTSQSHRCHGH